MTNMEPASGAPRTTHRADDQAAQVMTVSQLVAYLNAIRVGEMETIRAKLATAGEACIALGQPALAALLAEAGEALDQADLKTYRKRMETVIARLGHLRT